jgi:hypothetical protein
VSLESYIGDLPISAQTAPLGRIVRKGAPGEPQKPPTLPPNLDAAVDAGSIVSFVSGVDANEKADILFSVQLAQRGADAAFDRFAQTKAWYGKYNEVLEAVGWAAEQFAFAAHGQGEGDFMMDKAALSAIAGIATGNQLQAITASITALEKLADNDGSITLFDYHAAAGMSGNFQIGAVQKTSNGSLSMAAGAFYFRSVEQRRKFLFWRWGRNEINFWAAAQKMTLNTAIYGSLRKQIEQKLGQQALDYISGLDIRQSA